MYCRVSQKASWNLALEQTPRSSVFQLQAFADPVRGYRQHLRPPACPRDFVASVNLCYDIAINNVECS